jgi:hypothetical protein
VRLAEETGVDEATVLRWVRREELPPDEVIVGKASPRARFHPSS